MPVTKDELDNDLQDALSTMDEVWNEICDCNDSTSKEDLLDAIENACAALNDYDEDRFAIDSPEDSDEEAEAA